MTKRQLGYIFIALGTGAIAGMFLLDILGAGQFQGIGPAQKIAMLAAGAGILLGVSLLPLGDKPA
ncbi:MAG: hypothetical protein GY943_18995 [Chloroflexi bacterium]|nr:hypothetical protein [Chloroflexota bacterium]